MIDQIQSSVRVATAMVIGALVNWITELSGVAIPEDASQSLETAAIAFTTALIGIVYYAVVRALSAKWPWLEMLLVIPKTPVLVKATSVQQAQKMAKNHHWK